MNSNDFDVIVCGGGVAGAALASLLGERLRVAMIDARRPASALTDSDQKEIDPRVVAISPGSARILDAAGGWSLLSGSRIGPYQRMQVHAGSSQVAFRASEHGLDHLGWIIEVPALQQALWQALEQRGRVSILAPVAIERSEAGHSGVRIMLGNGQTLRGALLVAADGGRSHLRQQAGIGVDEWHYNQKALVTHIETERANDGMAWQRFTEHGPLALLPLADGRSSIVWSQPDARVEHLMNLDEPAFLDELNNHADSPFGLAIGLSRRHALPLVRRKARQLVQGRLVLVGDAARTVHPLAGQGLNLGLADAAALAEVLEAWEPPANPHAALHRYQAWRLSAGEVIGGGIHVINEFAHTPAGAGRGLLAAGFAAANWLWPLREAFVLRACGIDSDSPRLARSALSGTPAAS